jgi:two-component system chemotaxis response regulator CheY
LPPPASVPDSGAAAPKAPKAAADSPSGVASDSADRIALKVVLVEPSRTQSAIIRKYLQDQGVRQVVTVASGRDAMAAVRTDRPDAVISALHLNDTTGLELARQIRTAAAGTAAPGFVLISSESESAEAGALSETGRAIVLHKPFTPEGLADALRLVTTAPAAPASAERLAKLRVLVVDDSAPARMHVKGVLEGLGVVQFVEAPDGAQAVAAAARDTFDLIVTDYNMPLMDGSGLVGYLRQNPHTARVPIIMVTTETDPAKLDAIRKLGVTVCDKRFPPEVVRPILNKLASTS